MRYIVLSFDDGLLDFKTNVLPIIESKNFKVTINIISGFSDKTINTNFDYLNISDIKYLVDSGHEVAVHSNSHTHTPEQIEDFEICRKKLSKWTNQSRFGCVVPFINNVPKELIDYCEEKEYLYLSDWRDKPLHLSPVGTFYRILNKIFKKNKKYHCIFECYRVSYNPTFKNTELPRIDRITASRNNNYKNIIKYLKKMKNGKCLTIMFHSILNDVKEECDWPKAAWTTKEFNYLVDYLAKHSKKYKVTPQRDVIKYEK